jgi:hypothetical protein
MDDTPAMELSAANAAIADRVDTILVDEPVSAPSAKTEKTKDRWQDERS